MTWLVKIIIIIIEMSFPNDDSVQLSYTSFPFTPTLLDGYTTSNYVSNVSNILQYTNTKQPILTLILVFWY